MVKKGQKRRTVSLPRSLSHLQDHRAALFVAMIEYLRRLEWPSTGGHNRVTLIELALDFGVYSGLDLPPIQRGLPFTAASLADRARRFSDMLATLTRVLPRKHPDCAYHPADRTRASYSLSPLGQSAGLTKPPILLGGAETELVKAMAAHIQTLPRTRTTHGSHPLPSERNSTYHNIYLTA